MLCPLHSQIGTAGKTQLEIQKHLTYQKALGPNINEEWYSGMIIFEKMFMKTRRGEVGWTANSSRVFQDSCIKHCKQVQFLHLEPWLSLLELFNFVLFYFSSSILFFFPSIQPIGTSSIFFFFCSTHFSPAHSHFVPLMYLLFSLFPTVYINSSGGIMTASPWVYTKYNILLQ